MRSIKLRDAIFENGVRRIEIAHLLTQIRIRVSRIHRNAGCETFVDLKLKRVVTVAAVVLLYPEIGELWKRQQRLCPRDRRRSIKRTATRNEIPERIWNRRAQESIRRCIRRRVVA